MKMMDLKDVLEGLVREAQIDIRADLEVLLDNPSDQAKETVFGRLRSKMEHYPTEIFFLVSRFFFDHITHWDLDDFPDGDSIGVQLIRFLREVVEYDAMDLSREGTRATVDLHSNIRELLSDASLKAYREIIAKVGVFLIQKRKDPSAKRDSNDSEADLKKEKYHQLIRQTQDELEIDADQCQVYCKPLGLVCDQICKDLRLPAVVFERCKWFIHQMRDEGWFVNILGISRLTMAVLLVYLSACLENIPIHQRALSNLTGVTEPTIRATKKRFLAESETAFLQATDPETRSRLLYSYLRPQKYSNTTKRTSSNSASLKELARQYRSEIRFSFYEQRHHICGTVKPCPFKIKVQGLSHPYCRYCFTCAQQRYYQHLWAYMRFVKV